MNRTDVEQRKIGQMIIVLRLKILFVATFMFALAVAPASNAEDRGYGWMAAMDSTSANGDDVSFSFRDIIEILDFGITAGGAQVRVLGR